MTHMALSLSGLHCMGCAANLEKSLKQAFTVDIKELSPTFIEMDVDTSFDEVAKNIESAGYSVAPQTFQLSGLHCGNCVNKLTKHLETSAQIRNLHVEKEQMSLETSLSKDEIATLVTEVGFEATPAGSEAPSVSEVANDDIKKSQASEASSNISSESNQALTTTHLLVKGMTCASCVSSVEKALTATAHVSRAQVNLAEQSAIVFSNTELNPEALLKSVDDAGYHAEIVDDPETQQEKQQQQLKQVLKEHKQNAIFGLLVGIPIMLWGVLGGEMMISNSQQQIAWGIVSLICLLLLSTAGRGFYSSAWKSLMHKRATMDTLVALGTGVAWLYSTLVVLFPDWFPDQARHVYFEASAMIIGLISLGHAIESNAKAKTTQSLQALIKLQPKTATVIIDDKEQTIAIEQITVGMHIRIRSGDQVPVDGIVVSGSSYIDESMLTGEPIPGEKSSGDKVSAGTINQDGSLVIEATGVGSDTMLSRIISMVRSAQSSKPQIAKLADKISSVFVPVVVAIAIFSALIWLAAGPEPKISYMLVVATTVLIIACPCALGLATPLSVTVGIGKAAEMGILIKDADALQKASIIDTVVFDKTGTLTEGKPLVQNSIVLSDNEELVYSVALALEQGSDHPIAKALCQFINEKGISAAKISEFENLRGRGLRATFNHMPLLLASIDHLKNEGINLENAQSHITSIEENAQTPIGLAIDGQLSALFAVSDSVKSSAKKTIARLNNMGIETVMLTGDNSAVAQSIAKELGISTVISQVLPDEKAKHIKQLQQAGKTVAMIGDGINDAPALAQADIGVAMGEGSDVAIESAQIAFLNSSPELMLNTIALSKATLKNIKQNLFGAFIYNTLGIPIAAGVLFPFTGFLLSPVIAGAAMALSSITVVTNANRLRLFSADKE
ncbi:heavy metal translocating P-type ATPase [Vibrio viridaestus]|uniref:Copper-exporting P-type ATPase n=1 Tax=Vibrio viridaestus TaxID=2487322 RepID=A0A3N9U744_9VIBR|nr:copper-translocating P-type ATPase [Vibrio viridaestus]RQW63976.1 copper-translocating P-type ATPase [Vibrio viridaestus]